MPARTAFITGASRGIGRGIALELAANGFDIVGAATQADPANTEKGLYEVKRRVEEMGRDFLPVKGDITSRADHESMLARALERFGGIDVLVCNAGVAPRERCDILECTEDSYDRVMDINARGAFFFAQLVAKHMVRRGEAETGLMQSMIFVTSISADTASTNRVEYCMSKAALSMAAQTFAVRLACFGINVYEIRPGVTETDMTAAVKDKYDAAIAEGVFLQPRWGTPADMGRAVAALAQGCFAYGTGAVIELGGGFGVKRL